MNIIGMSADFRLIKARRQFALLHGILDKHVEDLERNPGKYLEQANEEVYRTRKLLEDVKHALLGDITEYDPAQGLISIESELLSRHNKALHLLEDFN